jgi:hypothetical protein
VSILVLASFITLTAHVPLPRNATITANSINEPQFFVREHYLDFLNRNPDDPGLNFWTNNITQCGADSGCIEVKRINTSAAFFLSIEFQNTGYLVYRTYKVAYGNMLNKPVPINIQEFLPDTQLIGNGVVVNQGDWQAQLESNKQAYFNSFVMRDRFMTLYPSSISPEQFVDSLNSNSDSALSSDERNALVNDLRANAKTRAQVIRAVAEDSDLYRSEFNKAFVLMQYFGYLKRNPDDLPDSNFSGWMFWLNKLNEFNGNFVQAEMVKAFLASDEYQKRFDTQVWNAFSNQQLGFSFRYPTLPVPTTVTVNPSVDATSSTKIVRINLQENPLSDPTDAFSIGVYDNPTKQDLQTWFEQNVDVNNILTTAGIYQSKTLANGVVSLVLTNDLPDQYRDERGGDFTDYAYWVSPSHDRVFSIGRGQDSALAGYGYSSPAIDDLMLRVAGTFSF